MPVSGEKISVVRKALLLKVQKMERKKRS